MLSGRFGSSSDSVGLGGWLGRLARSRVRAVLAGVVVLAALAVPPSASAHLRSGTVAIDYRARVFDAGTSAYSAQIFQSDRALSLTLEPGHVVVLVGYLGEPVFRLDASGLRVNAASPTAVVAGLVKKSERVPAATPRWRLASGRRSVVWHDARVQRLPQGVRRGVWSVPLIVDGRRSHVRGELQRFPAPALWPWLGALAALLVAGAAPVLLHRRDLVRPAATGFAVMASAASVLMLFGFGLDAYASPGTWIEAADAGAFIGVGIWFLLCGPERWRVAGALGAGLVALAVGLLEAAVFLHPIVLAVLPAVAARLACVVAIGAGLDAAALGALLYAGAELAGAGEPPEPRVPVSGSTSRWMGARGPGRFRD